MRRILVLLILSLPTLVLAQGWNVNVGGLPFRSGASVPGTCSVNGALFFKTTATRNWYYCSGGTFIAFGTGTGSGSVTSVGFIGGLISVGTPTTTPAFTVAGTSGGIPYFDGASTWASSAALGAGQFVLGGGAGAAPTTSFSVVPVVNGGTGAAVSPFPPNTSTNFLYTTPQGGLANQAGMTGGSNVSNTSRTFAWIVPFTKTATKVCYEVGTTADNTANNYSLGIYTGAAGGSGTLIAHVGPTAGTTFAPTTSTFICANLAEGSVTIPAGRVYVSFTTNATTPATFFAAGMLTPGVVTNTAVTAAGTLNTPITLPADTNSGFGSSTNVPALSFQ